MHRHSHTKNELANMVVFFAKRFYATLIHDNNWAFLHEDNNNKHKNVGYLQCLGFIYRQ